MASPTGTVYLLHYETPISPNHTTQHYIGWASSLGPRIATHRTGNGEAPRLSQVAKSRNIGFSVVRTWDGKTKDFERLLKNRKNAPSLCPVCNPNAHKLAEY